MKFTVNITPENHPQMMGEILRDNFFNQSKGRGCYSVFEKLPYVVELPDESIDEDYDSQGIKYHVFSKVIDGHIVIMKYYWDGDGTLEFHFEDGSFLSNDDCKKDYTWDYYPIYGGHNDL